MSKEGQSRRPERQKGGKSRYDRRHSGRVKQDHKLGSKNLTRRQVLILFGGGALVAAGVVALTRNQENTSENPHQISEAELKAIAAIAIDDYNGVMRVNIPAEQANAIHLINTLPEYQQILAQNEHDYQPRDESDRPMITIDGTIYTYKKAVENLLTGLPMNDLGQEAKQNLVEFLLVHELAHASRAQYPSESLDRVIYGQLLAQNPELQGTRVNSRVEGAEVVATIGGIDKSVYQLLEEAEAIHIGQYVMVHRGRRDVTNYPPPYVPEQFSLLGNLLNHMGNGYDSNIKSLAQLRMEERGREQWMSDVGSAFGYSDDPFYAGASILLAIDRADASEYQQLTGQ